MQYTHVYFSSPKPTLEQRRTARAASRAKTNLRDLRRAEIIGDIIGMAIVIGCVWATIGRMYAGGAL